MTFNDLVKQLLVVEAGMLGKSFTPRDFPKQSSMPDMLVKHDPEEGEFQRGSYLRSQSDDELTSLSAVAGSERDPEEVTAKRKQFDELVQKLSSVIKDDAGAEVASGKLLKHLSDFNVALSEYKSKRKTMLSKERIGFLSPEKKEAAAAEAAEAKQHLGEIARKTFESIKSGLSSNPELQKSFDTLAILKDFLLGNNAEDVASYGVDHTDDAIIRTLQELNWRLTTSLQKRSESPLSTIGVQSALKSSLDKRQKQLDNLIKKGPRPANKRAAIDLAKDATEVSLLTKYYNNEIDEATLRRALFV